MLAIIMAIPLFAGWLLDFAFGSPVKVPNISNLVQGFSESLFAVAHQAFPETEKGGRGAGNAAAALAPSVCLIAASLLLAMSYLVHPALWLALETLFSWQLIGARKLSNDGRLVYELLQAKSEHGDLSRARLALSKITDAETLNLNSRDLNAAAVLAIRRGACERVVAPMFFLAVAGASFGVFYSAVNRLYSAAKSSGADAAASPRRLKAICEYIPKKLTYGLMPAAAALTGLKAYTLGAKPGGPKPEYILLESRLMLGVSALCAALLTATRLILFYLALYGPR